MGLFEFDSRARVQPTNMGGVFGRDLPGIECLATHTRHLVRRQAAGTLQCAYAIVRMQALVRARRARLSSQGSSVEEKLDENHAKDNHSSKTQRTKREVMEEIIWKSKFFKKAKDKEENEELIGELDRNFTSLVQSEALLSLTQPNKMNALKALVNKSISNEFVKKDVVFPTLNEETLRQFAHHAIHLHGFCGCAFRSYTSSVVW
ncbi:hypothetical protein U1Q18_043205 [Sarracenia purpurea var. burkii]